MTKLPRTGFYDTRAVRSRQGLQFLFRSDNALYAWIVLPGIAGLAIVRIVQLVGLFAALRMARHRADDAAWTLGGYILAINGPVASPKYRFPIEPVLAVLTGAGYCTFRKWLAGDEEDSAPLRIVGALRPIGAKASWPVAYSAYKRA